MGLILNQLNRYYTLTPNFLKIPLKSFLLHLYPPSGVSISGFQTKILYASPCMLPAMSVSSFLMIMFDEASRCLPCSYFLDQLKVFSRTLVSGAPNLAIAVYVSVFWVGRQKKCQLLRIEGVTWSAQRIPAAVNLSFQDRSRYFFIQIAPQLSTRG
jgi:hypothetical protein